jgi:alkaline phosphatase
MFKLKKDTGALAAVLALVIILWASVAQAAAKNVILMISDGLGYNTIKATDYFTGSTAVYESFPVRYAVSTYSAGLPEKPAADYNTVLAWGLPGYLKFRPTDSASAATAMATGVKNYDGVLNISTTGQQLKTITEIANDFQKSSGVVTNVQWSQATPAGMFAHNASRNNYAAIAMEMVGSSSPLKVIMGAGNPNYDNNGEPASKTADYVGGTATWNDLVNGTHNGFTLLQTKSEFEKLANGITIFDKVVGTFQTNTTAQQARTSPPKGAAPENPSGVAFNSNVPSLATMTLGALNVLTQDQDGFFLMIEGGAVDWANHANQLGRMIEEQQDFNEAVEAVVTWIEKHGSWSENLLIVTSDHATGALWGPKGVYNDIVDNGKGNLPGAQFYSGEHTNELVPLFAKGAGSELFAAYADKIDPMRGAYIDNTAIFQVLKSQLAAIPYPVPCRSRVLKRRAGY